MGRRKESLVNIVCACMYEVSLITSILLCYTKIMAESNTAGYILCEVRSSSFKVGNNIALIVAQQFTLSHLRLSKGKTVINML